MSEKITRVSESTRSHGGEHRKGDLSYARNRTIGAGTESEEQGSMAGMVKRRSGVNDESGLNERPIAGSTIISERKGIPAKENVNSVGANHPVQTNDNNLSKNTRVIATATASVSAGGNE